MSIEQLPIGAENAETIINELFASIEHLFVYCNDPRTTSGLDRGYYGGSWLGFATSDSTHTFGTSTTTYVSVVRATGALNFSTSNSNYNNTTNYAKVEVVVTGPSSVTSVTNGRSDVAGVAWG